MRATIWLILISAIAMFAVAGCSDDSTAPEAMTTPSLIEGEIGTADFEITLGATGDNRRHFEGPFVLRGYNLHYVDSLQALVVDLTISNRGEVAHAEPVGLTFVQLIPEGVTVQNPDNGINGEGAAITFAFANDDTQWTPGETSLPRTVRFGVGPGISIGFAARLDIGEPIDGGTIAGRVWNDGDEDGVIDTDEDGLRGVRVVLRNIGDEDTTVTDAYRTTRTDRNGLYAFHRLPAGVYVVSKAPNADLMPTTPTEITVLLTESSSDVSDFLDANFGCIQLNEPPAPFPLGAFAAVNGDYATDPDRVIAQGIDIGRCDRNDPHALSDDDDDDDGDDDGDDDDGDDDNEDCSKGKLRGPVTAVDEEGGTFDVMGTTVSYDPARFDIEIGQRLDVRVRRDGDGLRAYTIKPWHAPHEQVHGRIDSVDIDDDGVVRLHVLNTLVIVSRDKAEGI